MIPHALYIHIPFCKTICTYCAFNTYADRDHLIDHYVLALARELQIIADSRPGLPIKTVFFGGGTPSLLSAKHYETLLQTIQTNFILLQPAEVSLEANPNDVSKDYLEALRAVGINRISLGMQSAHERELRLFDRRHTMETTVQAVEALRAVGFENYSLDLIFGIPGQSLDDWLDTLNAAIALRPKHFSLYGLELKGGTKLKDQVAHGEVRMLGEELYADMYEAADTLMKQALFEQYEISNWAQKGYEAQHNLQYWRNLPYLGVGAGAHGYVEDMRTIVVRSPEKYIERLNGAPRRWNFPRTPATSKATPVSREEAISETIMMGLRLVREGIDRATFYERFGLDLVELKHSALNRLAQLGMITLDKDAVRLTPRGRFVSNAILAELI
ncbi:MAG: radical SAM family heme chaperone HemW [Anaerolineae bacterium]|nr:radical SAM family heme chaperone HemW [Anaerolineae bacterium]